MSDLRDWVTAFFGAWQTTPEPEGRDKIFYEVLADLDTQSLVPSPESMIGLVAETDEEQRLFALWRGWTMFFAGAEAEAHKNFAAVHKQHPNRIEPLLFTMCAALLQSDKKTAYQALERAEQFTSAPPALALIREKFGVRGKPTIPFLDRDNPINVSLGKARKKS